jgi:hypothetical protein
LSVSDILNLIQQYGVKQVFFGVLLLVFLACINGIKCLLRSEMLQIYYTCEEKGEIRQYQLENFHRMYRAYKLLLGNSFIDEIRGKVITWRVIT